MKMNASVQIAKATLGSYRAGAAMCVGVWCAAIVCKPFTAKGACGARSAGRPEMSGAEPDLFYGVAMVALTLISIGALCFGYKKLHEEEVVEKRE